VAGDAAARLAACAAYATQLGFQFGGAEELARALAEAGPVERLRGEALWPMRGSRFCANEVMRACTARQHGVRVARRLADERQADMFGASCPAQPAPAPQRPPAREDRGKQGKSPAPSFQQPQDTPAEAGIDTIAARLSPAELDELAAALPDNALAHLALAALRQLRRRLARAGTQGRSKGRASTLERAARQIASERGGMGGGEEG
jgi:hypothetical protein